MENINIEKSYRNLYNYWRNFRKTNSYSKETEKVFNDSIYILQTIAEGTFDSKCDIKKYIEGGTTNQDPKEKLILRIKNEKLDYKESFSDSLINQYTCTNKKIYINGQYEEENYITAPQYTDDTILEQAYKLAHELGHYYINKNLSPKILKISQLNNIFIKNIIERKAWDEAKAICIEEGIPVENEFNLTKEKCLDTYTQVMKNSIKNGIFFTLNMIKMYYFILIGFYIIYKSVNDGLTDFFGLLKLFNGINIEFIYTGTEILWVSYVMLLISLKIKKLIGHM